jgi:hypothetical protein
VNLADLGSLLAVCEGPEGGRGGGGGGEGREREKERERGDRAERRERGKRRERGEREREEYRRLDLSWYSICSRFCYAKEITENVDTCGFVQTLCDAWMPPCVSVSQEPTTTDASGCCVIRYCNQWIDKGTVSTTTLKVQKAGLLCTVSFDSSLTLLQHQSRQ